MLPYTGDLVNSVMASDAKAAVSTITQCQTIIILISCLLVDVFVWPRY